MSLKLASETFEQDLYPEDVTEHTKEVIKWALMQCLEHREPGSIEELRRNYISLASFIPMDAVAEIISNKNSSRSIELLKQIADEKANLIHEWDRAESLHEEIEKCKEKLSRLVGDI